MSTAHARKDDVMVVGPTKKIGPKIVNVEGIDDPNLCIFCNKSLNRTLDLLLHLFGHFCLKIFSCPQCPAKFQHTTSYNHHLKKNHSLTLDDAYECRFCKTNNSFTDLFQFVVHSFTHHLDEGDQINSDLDENYNYDCRFCFMNFTKW